VFASELKGRTVAILTRCQDFTNRKRPATIKRSCIAQNCHMRERPVKKSNDNAEVPTRFYSPRAITFPTPADGRFWS